MATITIDVKMRKTTAEIWVTDQGIGISPQDQAHLFEKFFRTSEASKYSTTGSGLGLYVLKKALMACEGSIRCESKVGKGSTFVVTLPIKGPKPKEGVKSLIERRVS